jgi:Notch-like protein
VRACYGGPEGTEGLGRCVAGTQTCLPDGSSWGICDGQVLPGVESCNGEDDDCSGLADDDLDGAGVGCALGIGACAAVGVVVCDPMAFELRCDAEPAAPSEERCDGLDNNCDGRVDETFPVGEACALGLGQCLVQGVLACDAEGGVLCDAQPTDPVPEICDDLDNDCDGEIDNGFDLGAACSMGVGECVAAGGLICDGAGGVRCSALPGEPGLERCNGLDDDCDGVADDQPGDVGGACDTGRLGACARGAVVCVEGALACGQAAQPAPETCNDVDDDCNGVTDDTAGGALLTQACYDGPGGTSGVGPCAGGRQTCRAGRFGPCEGQTLPGAEVCDTVDNNCDGRVDNLAAGMCACEPGSSAVCYTGPQGTSGVGACRSGRWTCNADGLAYGACEGQTTPAVEVCDGVDNDCNGQVDDAIAGTGGACSAGVGECNARGVLVCDPRAGRIVCNAVAGQPRAELCDTRDNDCDGTVDDGFAIGSACSAGVGACVRNGVQACNAQGGLSCGAVAGNPAAETCNNIDDDCDGAIDDGLNLGAVCTVGVGACARQGRNVCGGNGAVVCSVAAGVPAPEVCDGVDNNCNGTTDENNPGGGGACNTGLQGVCSQGVLACVNAGLRCQQSVQSSAEVCDGRDNNCNGTTDESAANGGALTQACYDGAGGFAEPRHLSGRDADVSGGRLRCVCRAGAARAADLCDGLDNNCNGTTDEQPNGADVRLPARCQSRSATPARPIRRVWASVAPALRPALQDGSNWGACNNETLPAAEVCDNAGQQLQRHHGRRPRRRPGLRRRSWATACVSVNRWQLWQTRQLVCSVGRRRSPTAEICDAIDNNCNGTRWTTSPASVTPAPTAWALAAAPATTSATW